MHFDNLLLGEQAEAVAGGQYAAPVEVGTADCVAAALGKSPAARGGANGINRLLHQQRFFTVQNIQLLQLLLQVCRQLGKGKLHAVQSVGLRHGIGIGAARIGLF